MARLQCEPGLDHPADFIVVVWNDKVSTFNPIAELTLCDHHATLRLEQATKAGFVSGKTPIYDLDYVPMEETIIPDEFEDLADNTEPPDSEPLCYPLESDGYDEVEEHYDDCGCSSSCDICNA